MCTTRNNRAGHQQTRAAVKGVGYVLADISDDAGRAAAMIWFKHNRYPPHVSDIVAGVESMTDAATDTGLEKYWAESWRAVCGDLNLMICRTCRGRIGGTSTQLTRQDNQKNHRKRVERSVSQVVPDIIKRLKTEKKRRRIWRGRLRGIKPYR